jgi:hypothetical protein
VWKTYIADEILDNQNGITAVICADYALMSVVGVLEADDTVVSFQVRQSNPSLASIVLSQDAILKSDCWSEHRSVEAF